MPERQHLCVFCGSSPGSREVYIQAAVRFGQALARRGHGLVYGGGRAGLMGAVADATLGAGGRVVGVIPDPLATKEIAHDGLSELFVVRGMHERKAMMASLSAGFLTLPGGIGTYEEFFEILTWSALGIHRKPIGILNVAGYFDPLLSLLEHAVSEGFLRKDEVLDIVVSDDPDAIAGQLLEHRPRSKHRTWININET